MKIRGNIPPLFFVNRQVIQKYRRSLCNLTIDKSRQQSSCTKIPVLFCALCHLDKPCQQAKYTNLSHNLCVFCLLTKARMCDIIEMKTIFLCGGALRAGARRTNHYNIYRTFCQILFYENLYKHSIPKFIFFVQNSGLHFFKNYIII